jgi:hypothetical protein
LSEGWLISAAHERHHRDFLISLCNFNRLELSVVSRLPFAQDPLILFSLVVVVDRTLLEGTPCRYHQIDGRGVPRIVKAISDRRRSVLRL